MFLLAVAIAPGLAICFYFFYRDVDREPTLNLIMSFLWGALATVPAIILELSTGNIANKSVVSIVLSTFFFIALAEEFSKFLPLRYYVLTRRSFDEPLDGIVYGVMISMGFATIENIMYVYSYGLSTALLRVFTAVPAHATFGVIMGYYAGRAKFDFINRRKLLFKGILGATIAHGFYDSFLFLNQNAWIHHYVSADIAGVLLFSGAMISLLISIRLAGKLIKLDRLTAHGLYKTAPVLTIRHASLDDIELIRSLALQIWPVTYEKILSQSQIRYMMNMIYSEQSLSKQMESGQRFIIVYNAGMPVGFAAYSETEPTVYKLHKIYLLPNQQGRGCGRFVIDQVISEIKTAGATALRLNVNIHNPAKGFYEKLGFKLISSENIDIGSGFFMNDYVMEKRLE